MKHLYTILLGCAVLLGPVSCMKIDNFEAPAAKIQGRIIDKTTGQPMLLDHGVSHIRIWEMSYSEHPTPQDLAIKEDGTYYNDKLFSGTYDMLPRDGAWWPCDTTYNVAIGKSGTVQDFEVTPYLHVVDFDATLDGTALTLTCRLQAPVTDGLPQIREIRPFINNNIHCGPGNRIDYYYNDANQRCEPDQPPQDVAGDRRCRRQPDRGAVQPQDPAEGRLHLLGADGRAGK